MKKIILILFVLVYNLCLSQESDSIECNNYNDSIHIVLKISHNKRFAVIEIENLSCQNYFYSKEQFEFNYAGVDKNKRLDINSGGSAHDVFISLGTIQPKSRKKQKIKISKGNYYKFYLNYLFIPESKLKDLGYKFENWDKKMSDIVFLGIACDIRKEGF